MVACSRIWERETGVRIAWDKRSLQDFEAFPVEELARDYDLIVIDHPHVGQITVEDCLVPLDVPGREAEREALSAGSVGPSYGSYHWGGHQWALPIDAASQVQAFRPDRLAFAPRRWTEIVELARAGHVMVPLRVPHSLMALFSLAGNLDPSGTAFSSGELFAPDAGARAYDLLAELFAIMDRRSLEMDPIAVFETMAQPQSTTWVSPLIYGYVNYAKAGFRPARLGFADIPAAGAHGPAGTALGGTGIAVSARSTHREQAIDFAYWIASGEVQRGPYAKAGGQPGHAAAWDDPAVNAETGYFYRNTRATLQSAWVRPRHNGYMRLQEAAAVRINEGLEQREKAAHVISDINTSYRASLIASG